MKFFCIALSSLLLAGSTLAQEFQAVFIDAPQTGQAIQAGSSFNVTLNVTVRPFMLLSKIDYLFYFLGYVKFDSIP
jgi:hypothetical protein